MCKSNFIKVNSGSKKEEKRGSAHSVLDNKETFLQKSPVYIPAKSSKKSFYNTYYKIKNLQLASKLEQSPRSEQKEINKTIRNLRYCAKFALLESTYKEPTKIISTSDTCNNPFCHICNRIKSAKLASRLQAFLKDPEKDDITKGKYFYFLTLTVRHDSSTRNFNYLEDFKKYMERLRRSTGFRGFANTYGAKKNAGMITSIENVISAGGYHIHSHNIIMTARIKGNVSNVEKMIRERWMKITGDSHMIRLDIIKNRNIKDDPTDNKPGKNTMTAAILETFKYTTKLPKLSKMGFDTLDYLTSWVIESKGKNMVNCSGLFRGHGLTAQKCDYDEKGSGINIEDGRGYWIDKTSQIKYNVNSHKTYTTEERREILKDVKIVKLSDAAVVISDVVHDFLWLFKYKSLDLPSLERLEERARELRYLRDELNEFYMEYTDDKDLDNRVKNVISSQLDFLDKLNCEVKEVARNHSHVYIE